MSKQGKNKRILFNVAVTIVIIAALAFSLHLVNNINRRMKESATSNLLSTTKVIHNTLESTLRKDLDNLKVVGEFCEKGAILTSEQINTLCVSMGFDWIGIVDKNEEGVGYFEGVLRASDIPCYEDWKPTSEGYSNPYIGESGRPQIALWIPVYRDGDYIGTVFGGVILSKYYSSEVFTFHEGEGRTYLFVVSDGTWVLKSLGTDGASTRQKDIYSLLSTANNTEEDVAAFHQAVVEGKTGTATLDFNGDSSYLCFMPVQSSPGWYITTVIPEEVLLRESLDVQRMIQMVIAVFAIALLFTAVALMVWWSRKKETEEAYYREALFTNISSNLDSAFLIYGKTDRKVEFVSDNVNRLFGLNREWLGEDADHLFEWGKFPADDMKRRQFLEGTLEEPAVREVYVENEMGESSRAIRFELIPADLNQQIAVLKDVTKDKEIQSSLIEAMRQVESASNAKNEFLSAMSHDLRTPINGIVGMTAIAAANLENKGRVRECLTKISESSAQLLSLINEVLDMSQIEKGKMVLSREMFNIAELLQQILSVNYPGIQEKKQTIKVYIHSMDHEEAIGDPARLTRVVMNLLSNAIKYTPENGEIVLSLEEKPSIIKGYGCYELMVQDNGIGMSKEFQKKMFEPFEREEMVRASKIQGTGLGMSIVKNIVDLMMGTIEVESEKGKGTTFRVTLNLRLNEQSVMIQEQLEGLPVLVVDDDLMACRTVAATLCDIGMKGEWSTTGAEAVERVSRRHEKGEDYLAVLLDWKMPQMDGVETARQIRAKVGPEIPIIILTAYEWAEIEKEAREAGVDAFMSKPIYKAKLLQKMNEISAGYKGSSQGETTEFSGDTLVGKRILLAEDNELNQEIAVELLQMMGIQVDCAQNGVLAVERFATSQAGTYDLILMDIQMPEMNGYQATETIRSMDHPDSSTIPIVAMTADALRKDEQKCRNAGMNEYLTKPVSVQQLKEVLSRLI